MLCILIGDIELNFEANAGIDEIVEDLQPFAIQQGISFGDVYVSIDYARESLTHFI